MNLQDREADAGLPVQLDHETIFMFIAFHQALLGKHWVKWLMAYCLFCSLGKFREQKPGGMWEKDFKWRLNPELDSERRIEFG